MTEEPFDILVIEDNPGDVRLIKDGFDESDVPRSLNVVTDGAEALDYLYRRNGHESAAKPDLVLVDLNVPKLTGDAVLERITDDPDFRSTPILVLSGSQSDDHVLETYRLGADGYFVKPVDPHEFISLVKTIGDSLASPGSLPSGEFADIDRPS